MMDTDTSKCKNFKKNIYYFKDEPKEQKKKLRFLCGVPPAQAGKLFRVGTAALPQPSSAAPTSLHLIPTSATSAVATPARSRRRRGPISRAPRLSHSLSTRPLASLLRFVPPPPPPLSRFR